MNASVFYVFAVIYNRACFSVTSRKNFQRVRIFTWSYWNTGTCTVSCVVSGRRRGMLCVWPVKINVPAHCGLSYARSDIAGWMHTDVFYQKEHFDRRRPSWSSILSLSSLSLSLSFSLFLFAWELIDSLLVFLYVSEYFSLISDSFRANGSRSRKKEWMNENKSQRFPLTNNRCYF